MDSMHETRETDIFFCVINQPVTQCFKISVRYFLGQNIHCSLYVSENHREISAWRFLFSSFCVTLAESKKFQFTFNLSKRFQYFIYICYKSCEVLPINKQPNNQTIMLFLCQKACSTLTTQLFGGLKVSKVECWNYIENASVTKQIE